MFTSEEYCKKLIVAAEQITNYDRQRINVLLEGRKINHLLHFTDSDNLISILHHGVLNRDLLTAQQLNFKYSDLERHDLLTNTISLSLAYPNSKMLYMKKMLNQNRIFVVLEISLNILYEKNSRYIWMPGNAARQEIKKDAWAYPHKYVGITGAARMFPPKNLRQDKNISSAIPLDIQAEIMFCDPIGPSKIQRIHCQNILKIVKPELAMYLAENFPKISICNNCKDRAFLKFPLPWQQEFKIENAT